jgi:phosphatidylglycerophosphate synthase
MADLLTGLRLLLIVPVCWGLITPGAMPGLLLLGLIAIAIVTDLLDGIVARARHTASARGMLFDHSTDFLFVTSGLGAAAWSGYLTPWLPVLIVIAFSQYVLDSYWLFRQKQLRMSFLGRWNGILYFVPLVLLALAAIDALDPLRPLLLQIVAGIAYVLLASTVASIIDRSIAPLRKAPRHTSDV